MESEPKRRKVNSSNANNPKTIFGHGCKGVFVTCDRNRENNAIKETYRLLEDYLEETNQDKAESIIDIPDTMDLDKELELLTKKDKPRLFARLDLGMKGISFIRILDERIDPVAAVKHLFGKIKSSGLSSTRFAARIIPIQYTCYAHLDDVIAIVGKAVKEAFTYNQIGKTWFCHIKRRNNDQFDKIALIKAIGDMIDESKNPVSIRDGDICVHVDINKGICGISVMTDYKDLNELSLRTVLEEKKPKKVKMITVDKNVNSLDTDWKCGTCGSPNYQENDICWKCQTDRRSE